MDKKRHRARGQCAFCHGQAIAAPVDAQNRLGDRASRLLILQRHAIGEAQQIDQFVCRQVPAVGHADLDLKRVASINGRRARDRGEKPGADLLLHARQDLLLADRRKAVGRRAHDLDAVDRLVQSFRFVNRDGVWIGRRPELRGLADLERDT